MHLSQYLLFQLAYKIFVQTHTIDIVHGDLVLQLYIITVRRLLRGVKDWVVVLKKLLEFVLVYQASVQHSSALIFKLELGNNLVNILTLGIQLFIGLQGQKRCISTVNNLNYVREPKTPGGACLTI